MRLSVIGNCQSRGLADCMKILTDQVKVESYAYNDTTNLDAISDNCDVVIIQNSIQKSKIENIASRYKTLVWPSVNFGIFHPDIVYAQASGKWLQSPLGDYNSSIVLSAWMQDLKPALIRRLFREEVYEALGFFGGRGPTETVLLESSRMTDVPLDDLLPKFKALGCFMHSINHPTIQVLGHVAFQLLRRLGLPLEEKHIELTRYMQDNLMDTGPVWPVYPEVAQKIGISGSLIFKMPRKESDDLRAHILTLEEYIDSAFLYYAGYDSGQISCPRLNEPCYKNLGRFLSKPTRLSHPYVDLPDNQFWKKAVASVVSDELDPVVNPKTVILPETKVSSAGSCFAQHISKRLSTSGFNHFITELPPSNLSNTEIEARSYGLFSARYGNVYTSRQLIQLFDRAYGRFVPQDVSWERLDGRFVDPFRPQIDPDGYASPEEVICAMKAHLANVRRMFQELDIFVFTLGLTECWASRQDGAVFPLAPGVVAGRMNSGQYTFLNLTKDEVVRDMSVFLSGLRNINPEAKVIITVSPVPLIATYEPRHVLVSTTYSKSVLRVAAQEVASMHDHVEYFPSYEIIVGNYNRGKYFQDDLRSVTAEGVDHVMRIFMKNYTDTTNGRGALRNPHEVELMKVFCDEEAISDT